MLTLFINQNLAQHPFFSDLGNLIFEYMPISMHVTHAPLFLPNAITSITQILNSLNIAQFVIVSHSYGTVVATHILHDAHLSTRVAATLFIDPIPFLLHLPNISYNFAYQNPRTANEWEPWYFASRDPDMSRAMSRHFFWTENTLWKEELEGKHVCVVLSRDDQIVDAGEVRKYLTGGEEERRWEKGELEVFVFFWVGSCNGV